MSNNSENKKTGELIFFEDFTADSQELMMQRLWILLQKQVQNYNGIDSSSTSVEKVQSLMDSLSYTLGVVMEEGTGKREMLEGNMEILLKKGQDILKRKLKEVKVDWDLLCRDLPPVRNVYFEQTMMNIRYFFKAYDIYYEAHEIPCSIDYWPLIPVPERLKGISYIEEYLNRIQMEVDFLHNFDSEILHALYKTFVRDYRETLFNLCEPVLNNALGLILLNENFGCLNISEDMRERLLGMLENRSLGEIKGMLEKAALILCDETGNASIQEKSYFCQVSVGLASRLAETVKTKDLSHVFFDFSPPDELLHIDEVN